MVKQWAQSEIKFDEIDKNKINDMKLGLLEIEDKLKQPELVSSLNKDEINNRRRLLSALGSVASFKEARLNNQSYADTLKDSIALLSVTPIIPAASNQKHDRFRAEFDRLVEADPAIKAGLKELSALIERKEQQPGAAR